MLDITEEEKNFIVDTALNALWVDCETKLRSDRLGDIEKKHLIATRDETKRLMKKLDPTVF